MRRRYCSLRKLKVTVSHAAERKQKKRREMFQKMQKGMDAMPEDFPPVAMFNDVAATRENSERILELLEKDRSGSEEPVGTAAK